jgi:hypothetical protein
MMNWETFLDNIAAGKIIPVVGDNLSQVKDEKGIPTPLYHYIARELTRKLKIPYTGQTISELDLAYPNGNIPTTIHTIYSNIDKDRFLTKPLEQLADITDFKFYVSTTIDGLLVNALLKERKLDATDLEIIDYSLQQQSEPAGIEPQEEKKQVTVFNLLGSLGELTECAVNEEEMLEHFISISCKQKRHTQVDYFLRQAKNKIFLFIGCDYPDWFMRFVIRILTNERFSQRNLSDYIVNDDCSKCPELNRFLTYFKKNIIVIKENEKGNTQAFINEFHERWTENVKSIPPRFEGTVFLSYYNKDREKVKYFKGMLRARGIQNVWFDIDDLEAGEHQKLIESEIKKCKIFIPLISSQALDHTTGYMWQVEWAAIEKRLEIDKKIIEFYGGDKFSFQLIPCVLDNTAFGDERIPDFMKSFSIWNLTQDQDKVIAEIEKYLAPLPPPSAP